MIRIRHDVNWIQVVATTKLWLANTGLKQLKTLSNRANVKMFFCCCNQIEQKSADFKPLCSL